MKKLLCLMLCLLLLLSSFAAQLPATGSVKAEESVLPTVVPEKEAFRYEGDGFDSPEAAVLYFLDGLKNQDLEQMLAAYAWETRIEHYSSEEFLRYRKSINARTAWLPGTADIIHRMNLEMMRAQEVTDLYNTILINLLPEEQTGIFNAVVLNSEHVDEYMGRFDSEKLESLREMTHIRFLTVTDIAENLISERMRKALEKETAIYGIDERIILPTIADVGDKKLMIAPTVARYGDRWYIFSPRSEVTDYITQNYFIQGGIFFLVSELPFSTLLARDAEEADRTEPAQQKARFEGGFSTPEDAAVSYLEGLKNLDLNQMLQAFAWETMAENYDLKKAIELDMRIIYSAVMPMISPFVQQAEAHMLQNEQIKRIYQSLSYYLLPDDFYRQNDRNKHAFQVNGLKDEELDELIQHFASTEEERLEKLTRLAHIRFISPSDIIDEESWQRNSQDWEKYYRTLYGADEIRSLIAIADIDEQHLFFSPTAIRYGDKWYLAMTDSAVINSLNDITDEFRTFGLGFAYGSLFPLQ